MKISIGTVSEIFNISKDTLRYYDKLGILTPEVNKINGYRFYDSKHMEQLSLILGMKYLGVSLADIKATIESGDINEYNRLVTKQQEVIENKITELKALKKSLDNTKKVIDKVSDFKNEYDFSKLKEEYINLRLHGINLENLINVQSKSFKMEKHLVNLEHQYYFYVNKIINNSVVEEESITYIKENKLILDFIESNNIKEEQINLRGVEGNFIKVNFYGTINEISNYILELYRYFNCNDNNLVLTEYEFYLPRKNNEEEYLVRIFLKR